MRARADKEATYPELLTGRWRLVVMAIETGGRSSSEAADFVGFREVLAHVRFSTARVGTALDADVVDGVSFCLSILSDRNFRHVRNLVLDRW